MTQLGVTVVALLLAGCSLQVSSAFHLDDVLRILDFPQENVTTGNKILYEEAGNVTPNGKFMEVNEIPVRYDEAQLWRIYNISRLPNASQFANTLESRFGGDVWKENSKFLDVSFRKEQVKKARSYLDGLNIPVEILNSNIQQMIDNQTSSSAREKRAIQAMDWEDYHDVQTIYEFMKELRLAYPNLCRLYTIGTTVEGRELKVMRITTDPKKNQKIWIDGGIHAREWISPAVVTYILHNLLTNWSSLPAYLTSKTWYVMPVMNPDGYTYSRRRNRLWRKNRSKGRNSNCYGVDLNRNFDINWTGPGSSSQPCSDTYRGPSPASELETQAVAKFLTPRKANLGAYLTFHSYGEVIVYPWAYKAAKVRDYRDLQLAGQQAVDSIKAATGRAYKTGPTYQLLGVAGGGSDDWCRAALGTKYVYTVELRDKGYYGFVLPKEQIKATAREGYAVVDTVAQFF